MTVPVLNEQGLELIGHCPIEIEADRGGAFALAVFNLQSERVPFGETNSMALSQSSLLVNSWLYQRRTTRVVHTLIAQLRFHY